MLVSFFYLFDVTLNEPSSQANRHIVCFKKRKVSIVLKKEYVFIYFFAQILKRQAKKSPL